MLISRLMTNNPVTISPYDTLQAAISLMERGKFRRLPVVEGKNLVGIVTDRDIRTHLDMLPSFFAKVVGSLGYLESTKVTAAMTSDPITVTPNQTAEDAARLMIARKIGGLPVVEGGTLLGVVTTTDVLRAFLSVERASRRSRGKTILRQHLPR
jgi:acetoin utilization protein AcuB